MADHLATYPLYGHHPITGRPWNRRIGTGYIQKPEGYQKAADRCAEMGVPFKPRWRNDKCRDEYFAWLKTQDPTP